MLHCYMLLLPDSAAVKFLAARQEEKPKEEEPEEPKEIEEEDAKPLAGPKAFHTLFDHFNP